MAEKTHSFDAWFKRLVNLIDDSGGELGMKGVETFALLHEIYDAGRIEQAKVDWAAVAAQWRAMRTFPLWEDHIVLAGYRIALAAVAPKGET